VTRRRIDDGRVSGRPCLATDQTAQHCIVGLLLGVACCPDGSCGLCRATIDTAQRWDGFTAGRALRSLARTRGTLACCPTCGFPPPPPMARVPQLPRLERNEHAESNAWNCRVCGKALTRGRRQFCSDRCYQTSEHERPRELKESAAR
jgi:hypothetical protein